MKIGQMITGVVMIAVAACGGLDEQRPGATGASEAVDARPGVPVFEVDPAWPQIPAKWKLGDISSIAIDAKDNVWVLQRPRTVPAEHAALEAPPIIVFDAAGRFLHAWGGPGSGYDWPEREHGITIDHKGFVWIGGNHCAEDIRPNERGIKRLADDYLLKFTQAGKLVMQIGKVNQSAGNADTRNLRQPADAVVHPATNELLVGDGYGNHRVIVFDADTGAFKRMWGAFGNKPVDFAPCPPANPAPAADGRGPEQFSTPHAIRVSRDGLVYVADREFRRVQVFTLDGKYVKQAIRNVSFGRNLALSADRDQRFLYTGGATEIMVLDRKSMEIVGQIGGGGVLGGGHHIATDSKGNIYIAQTNAGMQKLVFKGIAAPR